MNDLTQIKDIVEHILEKDEAARNNDNYLYYETCLYIARRKGIDLEYLTFKQFLLGYNDFPTFGSVTRSRRKAQELRPELRANKTVRQFRKENEAKYMQFALASGVMGNE